ncbi:putative cuticle collagen 80 [Poecile atricapillus]|uniref:putative cuticle collagen 80 n=1 Tax=Poecile atricapillus TaxID=48891 RepID=UPI00273881B3|nr:putative cuticle collagen 80 [Poecile atricapillus]
MRRSRPPCARTAPAPALPVPLVALGTSPSPGTAAAPRSPGSAHRRHGCGCRRCPRGARSVCARPPGSASRGTHGGMQGCGEGGARGPGPAAAAPRGPGGAGGRRLRWEKLPGTGDLPGRKAEMEPWGIGDGNSQSRSEHIEGSTNSVRFSDP